MRGIELRIVLDLPLQIHLSEHVQGGLFPCAAAHARPGLGLDTAHHFPAGLTPTESERLAIVPGSNDLALAVPDQACIRQRLHRDTQHRLRRAVRTTRVDDSNAAVVRRKGQGVTARAERHGVHPSRRIIEVLAAHGVEGQPLAPYAGLGTLVDALDEAREHAGVGVGRPGGQEHTVWVPRQSCHGAADRLFQVFRDPPVVFLFKVADCNEPCAGADGEFLLRGRPADERGGSVDAEEDQRGFPA